jgi:hypothetical protein
MMDVSVMEEEGDDVGGERSSPHALFGLQFVDLL